MPRRMVAARGEAARMASSQTEARWSAKQPGQVEGDLRGRLGLLLGGLVREDIPEVAF